MLFLVQGVSCRGLTTWAQTRYWLPHVVLGSGRVLQRTTWAQTWFKSCARVSVAACWGRRSPGWRVGPSARPWNTSSGRSAPFSPAMVCVCLQRSLSASFLALKINTLPLYFFCMLSRLRRYVGMRAIPCSNMLERKSSAWVWSDEVGMLGYEPCFFQGYGVLLS